MEEATKKTLHLIYEIKFEKKTKNLQTFDLSCFISKSYFDDDGSKHYLTFQPIFMYFQVVISTFDKILYI